MDQVRSVRKEDERMAVIAEKEGKMRSQTLHNVH